MEKYLVDLFVASARQQKARVPDWLLRFYLSLFSPPLGKTLRLDLVKDIIADQDLQGKRVLDIGCGIGDLSFLLAQRGADVVGVELDEQKVSDASSIAHRWHFDNLRFIAGDATKVDQMNLGQFDAIFCLALLEHIKDDTALLQKLNALLRPGGLFVLEVPSARRRTIPEVEAADGHMRPGYVFEDLPEQLAREGFVVLKGQTMDPLGLIYYWCIFARIVPWPKIRQWLFAALAPFFILLIRLTSSIVKRPGAELCFLARKQ